MTTRKSMARTFGGRQVSHAKTAALIAAFDARTAARPLKPPTRRVHEEPETAAARVDAARAEKTSPGINLSQKTR